MRRPPAARWGGPLRARQARHAAEKFMWAIAGNLPGFEEAPRALYAGDLDGLRRLTSHWPPDVRDHVVRLTADGETPATTGQEHAT